MKLQAHIPIERIDLGHGAHTFESKLVEAEAVRIIRSPARHDKDRYPWRVTGWYYSADIAEHPELEPTSYRAGPDGEYRVHINRVVNRRWKPPIFPEGQNWVDVVDNSVN